VREPDGERSPVVSPSISAGGASENPEKLIGLDETQEPEARQGTEERQAEAPRRIRALINRLPVRRATLAGLGFLIGALILPAATKQWSDRAGELALKNEAVKMISESASGTILTAECIVQFCMPELAPLRDSTLTLATVDPDLFAEAKVAVSREVASNSRNWFKSRDLVDGLMETYFPGTTASDEWTSYAEQISAYRRLGDFAQPSCDNGRTADIRLLRAALPCLRRGRR
jgi:hypothetical protein